MMHDPATLCAYTSEPKANITHTFTIGELKRKLHNCRQSMWNMWEVRSRAGN